MLTTFIILCATLDPRPSSDKALSTFPMMTSVEPSTHFEHGRSLIDPGCTSAYPCLASDNSCYPYKCGTNCKTTPCTCIAWATFAPNSGTGACPTSRPCKTTNGCCFACAGANSMCYRYSCPNNVCSPSYGIGCTDGSPPSPPPTTTSTTTTTTTTTTNSVSSPPPSSASTSTSTSTSTDSSALTGGTDGICKALANVPAFRDGACSCKATTAGTGLAADCTANVANTKLGLHLDLEPCASTPYAELSYSVGGGKETSLGKFEAGKVHKLEVPGLSVLSNGVFITVEVKGNAADFTVHTGLSICAGGDCDGDLPWGIGYAATAAGFPMQLATFDDLSFVDSCPANTGMVMYIGAAVGALAVIGLAVLACAMYNKRKQPAPPSKDAAQPGVTINMTVTNTATVPTAVPNTATVPTAVPTAVPMAVPIAAAATGDAKEAEATASKV